MAKLNLCLPKGKELLASVFAFSKRNAPSLMTGGSILLGWTAVYIFWKQSKKADSKIAAEEKKLSENSSDNEKPELPKKEKAIIYLQYCWLALILGVGSSGLSIWAHKIDLSRLAQLYMLKEFLEEKSGKQETLINELKGAIKDKKKITDIEDKILGNEHTEDDIVTAMAKAPGNGQTLIIDRVTGAKFRANILDVRAGIARTNEALKNKRNKMIKGKLGSPFFSSSNTSFSEYDLDEENNDRTRDIYSSIDLEAFLREIGEFLDDNIDKRIGEILEFRYYGGGDLLKDNQILSFKNYLDPATGIPAVCFLDYTEYLSPSSELIERNPL